MTSRLSWLSYHLANRPDSLSKRARFFDLGELIFGQVGPQAIPRGAAISPAVYRWCASWDVLSVIYITEQAES
jgi:hypothetical protein